MTALWLRIELLSDSAFGRGDGVAGLVNSEVEHEAATGLPYIKGRTLKGLLVESCADLLYALQIGQNTTLVQFSVAAENLFGKPGSTLKDQGNLHVGSAHLPIPLRKKIIEELERKEYTPQQVLQGFTTIRHQTAVDAETGAPKANSLRATRVVLRGTVFYAELHTETSLDTEALNLLTACVAGVKRGGQNRTRGLGDMKLTLYRAEDGTAVTLDGFRNQIGGGS